MTDIDFEGSDLVGFARLASTGVHGLTTAAVETESVSAVIFRLFWREKGHELLTAVRQACNQRR